MTTYDDAPPHTDADYAGYDSRPADPTLVLAKAIIRLAESIDHLAVSAQARTTVPSGGPPSTASPPSAAPGPPGGQSGDSAQVKKGKAIFAICKKNNWDDIADIGQRVTGRSMHPNSQKWDEADQDLVLDTMKNVWHVG